MKTIYVIRHAQAIGKDANIPDVERTLTAKGVKDSRKSGKALGKIDLNSVLLISSHANRALETAQQVAKVLDYHPEKILLKEAIYDCDNGTDLVKILQELDDGYTTAVVVGHEPTLSQLIARLIGIEIQGLPKAAMVGIDCDTDSWSTIGDKAGSMTFFDAPLNKADKLKIVKKVTRSIEKQIAEAIASTVSLHDATVSSRMKKAVTNAASEVAQRLIKESGDSHLIRQYLIQQATEPASKPESARSKS